MYEYAKEAGQGGQTIATAGDQLRALGGKLGEVKPASPVESALHSLSESTESLHKILSELERRLSMVLGPQPTGKESPPEPNPANTVAMRVSASARSVSGACSRIGEMLHRLEL